MRIDDELYPTCMKGAPLARGSERMAGVLEGAVRLRIDAGDDVQPGEFIGPEPAGAAGCAPGVDVETPMRPSARCSTRPASLDRLR